MEWVGFIALAILVCYVSYPNKVRRLEKKVKKLERTQRGENDMSKIIEGLVGKKCKIQSEEGFGTLSQNELTGEVLDVDDEWIQFRYENINKKESSEITRLIRIEKIDEIEIIE